jgi:hypothetical protein
MMSKSSQGDIKTVGALGADHRLDVAARVGAC